VLGELVGRSGFSPEAALQLHKTLYRQKLEQVRPGAGVAARRGLTGV
jgi:hypothetical protein